MKITKRHARKVLKVVDVGLTSGLGDPEPGKMCVEAAVCYALGLTHRDDPECVASSLNKLKIVLNDGPWSSIEARAKGMRKLAILQLGTAGIFDDLYFVQKLIPLVKEMAARAAGYAAAVDAGYAAAADAADAAADAADAAANAAAANAAVYAANAAVYAADAAIYAVYAAAVYAVYASADAADGELIYFADKVADILIEMKVPAVKWLDIL